ncbi:heme-binding domain-containing protein [uncultured Lutibacter sp.]|uniref:heme-binding domain-containing protein n=1 Tax=uncultured Lutibacter sp. TaxID=437739 RepID=UPI0026211449|nr:heme-binding domain-containing protein [uncultured Lutibacter sp.]
MKKILLGILVFVALIQFIRPEKNSSKEDINHISKEVSIPINVQEIIKISCADCHSNNTVYPWYSKIAPISWYLAMHVNDGKEHLNFSEWTLYNKNQKAHILKDLKEVLKNHKMPLQSYLWLHKNAELTNKQYAELLNWTNSIIIE